MLVIIRDHKVFWVMGLKASASAWGIFECVMGTSTAKQQSKCHSIATNPNHRTTQDTLKKIISTWARPTTVYFCINFIVRREFWFIFGLEHYERRKASGNRKPWFLELSFFNIQILFFLTLYQSYMNGQKKLNYLFICARRILNFNSQSYAGKRVKLWTDYH